MTFITWKQMKLLIEKEELIKDPNNRKFEVRTDFSESGASIDLSLGEEVFITPQKLPKRLKTNETVNIEPGQFAALITEEILKIPKRYIGFITIRFGYKSKGLVNISGFHVDPGFHGRLVFSVYNTGSSTVNIRRGERIFSLFIAKIEEGAKYTGRFNDMATIPSSIIEPLAGARAPSLSELEDKVKKNETLLTVYGVIIMGLILSLIGAIISKIFQ